jgi:anti-sigma B factor antagonist
MPATHGGHWLEREDRGDVTVVRLKLPRLGDDDAQAIFKQVYSLVDDMGRNKLVLDLGPVEYLPSVALGKLVMLNRKAQAANGRLALCQLSPDVRDILDVTHLSQLFQLYATEGEAVQSFAAGAGP